MKIVVIGVGSFVFGPSVLSQALLEHRMSGIELALVDVDRDVVEGMAGLGRRMACESGAQVTITTHTERTKALDGANFVICSAARQLHRRFAMDCSIVDRYLPGHLVTEFGGIAGISYSLRQIALLEEIASDMRLHCPRAWLLVSSNPLPRVCQAAHELGIQTAGFCSVSLEGYGMLWRIWHDEELHYPFTPAREQWDVTIAGLNHFCWVTGFRDRATGVDLLPELHARLARGASSGHARSDRMAHDTGFLLVPNDSHTQDFLVPTGAARPRITPTHGSTDEREARLTLLRAVADGTAPLGTVLGHPAWERPIDLVAALGSGTATHFHSLNLVNNGQIRNLPRGIYVETPASTSPEGPVPEEIVLPDEVLPWCERTARVTDTIVRAALARERHLVHQAVELDPTILDKRAGIAAINACVEAHADVLPEYH